MQGQNSTNNSTSTTNSDTPPADQPIKVSNTDKIVQFISKGALASEPSEFLAILDLVNSEDLCDHSSKQILSQLVRRLDRLQLTEFIFTDIELYTLTTEAHFSNEEWIKANIDSSKVAPNDSRWAVFLSLVLTKLYPAEEKDALFDHLLKVGKESKHGSLARHISIFSILSSVNI
jgi:hypothetical protein